MASDLKPRSIKISDSTWERWQAMASEAGASVTALITQAVDDLAAANARIAGLEMELRIRGNGAAAKVEPAKRSSKPDETEITLSLPNAFLAQMIPGDKVAMMEDEVLRRFGYGLFRKLR